MDAPADPIRFTREEPPAPGEAIELAEGVLWMRLPLPMALDHVNVFALDDGDGWTLIDTGFDTRRTREAWSALRAGPLAGRPVRRVIATHHHPDHIGLAAWFMASDGAELLTTRTAWVMTRMLQLDVQERPPAEALAFYRDAGMDPQLLAERARARPFNFADVTALLPLGYRRIAEGDRIEAGGRRWRVRVGHGHAPEHATLWSEDDNLVIAGDQVLASISPNLGVYPTEPLADPVREWLESCRALLRHARPEHHVLPGHKLPFTGLATRLVQLIENHQSALARLLDHLAEPRTAAECFQPLFRREIGPGEYGLALAEAVGHLNHLLHRGLVVRERAGGDGPWLWRRR